LTAASLWFGLLSSLSIERRTCLPKSPRRPTRRALPRAGTHWRSDKSYGNRNS